MQLASFSTGTLVELDGRTYRLAVRLPDGAWQAVDCDSSRLIEWQADELGAAYEAGLLRFKGQTGTQRPQPTGASVADLPERQQATVRFRALFLREMEIRVFGASLSREALEAVLRDVSNQLGRAKPVSIATYYRWRQRSQQGALGLVDGRNGPNGRRCSGAEIATQVMQDALLASKQVKKAGVAQSVTMAALKFRIEARIDEENWRNNAAKSGALQIEVPSDSTLHRIWNDFPAEDRAIAECGRIAARHLFRGGPGLSRPEACLDLAEYDETRLPIFLYDEILGVPLGRVYLSWYFDVYSVAPLGIYVGFEPPSDLTITSALRHACLPKAYVAREYPLIHGRFTPAGVPRKLTFDNGLCQWGNTIETACLDLTASFQFAAPRTPWFKSRVEGSFKLLNTKLLQEMPGFVLGKEIHHKDYDPVKNGCLGLRHFLYILHAWIIDVYLQEPQGMLKQTPAQLWEAGTRIIPPDFLSSRFDLDLLFGVIRNGRLDHRGVVFENLRYHSPEIHHLRRKYGEKLDVQVKIDPSDLSKVYVRLNPQSAWLRAEANEQSYAKGLSLHRHQLNLRNARDKFDDTSIQGLRRAQTFLHELIADALPAAMSIRTNSLIARTLGIGTQHIFNKLDHEGELGGLSGPFEGHPLNPFDSKESSPSLHDKRHAKPSSPTGRRAIPNFEADNSLGKLR